MKATRIRTFIAVLIPIALWQHRAVGQTESRSAADLIRDITHESDPPDDPLSPHIVGVFTCGSYLAKVRQERELTASLVKMGDAAVPALEDAMESLRTLGDKSPVAARGGAYWVLIAYAKIRGPAAAPILRGMSGDPRLERLRGFGMDQSIALALGLTSYVSSNRDQWMGHSCVEPGSNSSMSSKTPCVPPWTEKPILNVHCDRRGEPRDALDMLILSLAVGDQGWVEDRLGPRATEALHLFQQGRSWEQVRSDLYQGKAAADVSAGYRFDRKGRWSDPEETLEEREAVSLDADYPSPEIETKFVNGVGESCGEHRLKFVATMVHDFPEKYLLDNSDIVDVLRMIAQCASKGSVSAEAR